MLFHGICSETLANQDLSCESTCSMHECLFLFLFYYYSTVLLQNVKRTYQFTC